MRSVSTGEPPVSILRRTASWLTAYAAILSMGLWIGGFTFYSGVVVDVIHDEFGLLDGSNVTRRVTVTLNVIGACALAAWGLFAWSGRRGRAWWRHAFAATCLIISASCLVGQFVLHAKMNALIEAGRIKGIRTWHEPYLILSTLQWGVNLALVALAVWEWTGGRVAVGSRRESAEPVRSDPSRDNPAPPALLSERAAP